MLRMIEQPCDARRRSHEKYGSGGGKQKNQEEEEEMKLCAFEEDNAAVVGVAAGVEKERPTPGGGAGMLQITDSRTGKKYEVRHVHIHIHTLSMFLSLSLVPRGRGHILFIYLQVCMYVSVCVSCAKDTRIKTSQKVTSLIGSASKVLTYPRPRWCDQSCRRCSSSSIISFALSLCLSLCVILSP